MELESQKTFDISRYSNSENTVDREESSSVTSETTTSGHTAVLKRDRDSFGSDNEHSFCKKITFDFPANVEVFSENFICGDLNKGKTDVTVTSQSVFVSEELQQFLNSYSKLNVDYEIPQLEAAGHISHDEMNVVFPADVHYSREASDALKRNSMEQNMFTNFRQSDMRLQNTEGYAVTKGPKPKTLAEKRRLLEQEMKLREKVNQSIKKAKMKQDIPVKLKQNVKQVIRGIQFKKEDDVYNNNINERRSRRLLLWDKKDGDVGNENKLPNSKCTVYLKEEIIADDESNGKKVKRVKKKTDKKLKKIEIHKKLFKKLDSLPKRIHDDLGLTECNIEEETANLEEKTSKVGMILNIGVGRYLYDEAVHNLELVQGDNAIVNESTAKLAACAVVDRTAKTTVKRVLVPVACNKLISLMHQSSDNERRDNSEHSLKNNQDNSMEMDNPVTRGDDDDLVPGDVVNAVVDMVKYVVRKKHCERKAKTKWGLYDPAIPAPVVTKKTYADYASKYKKSPNKRVGDRVASQLSKLGATLIDFDDVPVSKEIHKERVCDKQYCQYGCVCESLQVLPRQPTHCGNLPCMFVDKCSCSLYDKLKQTLLPTVLRLQNETAKKMAKEERKYHQTIIMSKDKMVYSGNDNKKREIKLPVKYRDLIILSDSEEEMLTEECESFKQKNKLKEKTKIKTLSPIKLNNQSAHPVEQLPKTKPCYVALEKIDIKGVKSLCLLHNDYDCLCFKSSGDSKTYMCKRNYKGRNVAKKKTSGIRKIKCTFCEGNCVCSESIHESGFGIIQEVMSLQPEEFYGDLSEAASVSDNIKKIKLNQTVSTGSERSSGCKRLCNDCKHQSNMRFMRDMLSSVTAPLPVVHAPCRWWVIELEDDNSMVIRNTFFGIDVPYKKLFEAVKEASDRSCTVSLLLKGDEKNKYVYHEKYGAYAVPGLNKIIFFGPYGINENHDLKVFRLIAPKCTVGVPFLIANKPNSFLENKNDKTPLVLSMCDVCRKGFDYGVNSVWWYSESCRNHLIEKTSRKLTHSDNVSQNEHRLKPGERQSKEDIVVMETLDIIEHGVDVTKSDDKLDEVDEFISFEEEELQNLMEEHILHNETNYEIQNEAKPDKNEFHSITNKQYFLVHSVDKSNNKVNENHRPFNLSGSSSIKQFISTSTKVRNNHVTNTNNETENGMNAARSRGIKNEVKKKFVRIRISDGSKNLSDTSEKGLTNLTKLLEENLQQNQITRKTEARQNVSEITTTLENNKTSSHCASHKKKERDRCNARELSSCILVNESQQATNVEAEVVNSAIQLESSILAGNSSGHVIEHSLSDYTLEEQDVQDYSDSDSSYLSDEDNESVNYEEEVLSDPSDPHLIHHIPKIKAQALELVNFGVNMIAPSIVNPEVFQKHEDENLPVGVLCCNVSGVDAIPIIEIVGDALVIHDPLNKEIRHKFQHSAYASRWLERLFLKRMVFEGEVNLSWTVIIPKCLIRQMRFFNSEILTDHKLVVTPAGIKELEGDIDDLKKQRYRMKFEYNRKRLERLVDGQNQESSNIDLYTLLRKAIEVVKKLTEESIEITSNLSYLERRGRQLNNRLQSLISAIDPETQPKAKRLIKAVKEKELLKCYFRKQLSSGQSFKKFEAVDVTAFNDDPEIEVVSMYIPKFEATEKTDLGNLKRKRGFEEKCDNSETKKQKCSPSEETQNLDNSEGEAVDSIILTDEDEILPEASETEIVFEKINSEKSKANSLLASRIDGHSGDQEHLSDHITTVGSEQYDNGEAVDCIILTDDDESLPEASETEIVLKKIDSGKAKANCSLVSRISEHSEDQEILLDHITAVASEQYDSRNDVTVLTQQLDEYHCGPSMYEPCGGGDDDDDDVTVLSAKSGHNHSNIGNGNWSDSMIQTNSVILEDITPSNFSRKVCHRPKVVSIYTLPSSKAVRRFSQDKNMSLLRTEVPLINNEKDTETEVEMLSPNRETELTTQVKTSNECHDLVTVDATQVSSPTKIVSNNNEICVLPDSLYNGDKTGMPEKCNKLEGLSTVLVPQILPKHLKLVYKQDEKTVLGKPKPKQFLFEADVIPSKCTKVALPSHVTNTNTGVDEYKQTDVSTLVCLPVGTVRNNNLRKVTLIKPESIIKPNILVKNTIDGINLNRCVSNGTQESIGQQLSVDALNVTQNVESVVQRSHPDLCNLSNTSINLNACVSKIQTENLNQQLFSDSSVTKTSQSSDQDISPIICNVTNPKKKHIIFNASKPENIAKNNSEDTTNFIESIHNKSLDNSRNLNGVPTYVLPPKQRTLLPTPSLQNVHAQNGQQIKFIMKPNYSSRSILISHQANRSNVGDSSYQALQSFTTSQSTRHNIGGQIIRPQVFGGQSVQPNVVVNQFSNGRGVCTINPSTSQSSILRNTNTAFQIRPAALGNAVGLSSRFRSGSYSRQVSSIQIPPGSHLP